MNRWYLLLSLLLRSNSNNNSNDVNLIVLTIQVYCDSSITEFHFDYTNFHYGLVNMVLYKKKKTEYVDGKENVAKREIPYHTKTIVLYSFVFVESTSSTNYI